MKDEHIIETIGMTRIVIRDGKVAEVGEPQVRFCPLAKRFAVSVDPITKESVQKNIESRIKTFGMCTNDRQVLDKETFVLFGASELMSTGLRTKTLDAAVICADGAGTVIVRTPDLVQGLGGRMSGLVSTTPYPEVIKKIEEAGGIVIDKETAKLDVLSGLARAKTEGWTKTAVTIAGFQHELAEEIRTKYPNALIIAVHTSGVKSAENADRLVAASDLVFACASKYVRAAVSKALVQGGVGVPVYAVSQAGKRLIMERLSETDQQILVKNTKLPVEDMSKQPEPLV
ncbi:MAG: methanogenesis marker 8 protein [Methanocorpusculum sp.]|uniref:methanogenesis marker 8 protein n=1 Tax=Methanocorpusculum sp. TaxID=2058474 RepID=UPI002B21B76F|nr:methanogenesis marker 8 protein [Methanocorpusculum sp.]MEA5085886.1 methanogenesis marker 8 protein [Methanocorpusculum sp.]